MKSITRATLLVMLIVTCQSVSAQKFNNAGEYMDYIGKEYRAISADTWDYIGAVAHGKSARKVANKRADLIKTCQTAKSKVARMPGYEGDSEYRDSVLSYFKLTYNVLNGDYEKIMDMEEISEQSYDAMEAYLTAQEVASEKMEAASKMIYDEQLKFANKHGVTIIDKKDPMEEKMKIASEVMDYYNVIYLIFFKSYKQEAYMIDAMNKSDINGMEQNKNSLIKFAEEGLEKLSKLENYKNDNSLIKACTDMLNFYKSEAGDKMNDLTNFYMKKENYEKIKAAFDAKKQSERTQEDIDKINNAGNDYNKALEAYNKTNNDLNKNRNTYLNNWNKTVQTFLDKYVPRGK